MIVAAMALATAGCASTTGPTKATEAPADRVVSRAQYAREIVAGYDTATPAKQAEIESKALDFVKRADTQQNCELNPSIMVTGGQGKYFGTVDDPKTNRPRISVSWKQALALHEGWEVKPNHFDGKVHVPITYKIGAEERKTSDTYAPITVAAGNISAKDIVNLLQKTGDNFRFTPNYEVAQAVWVNFKPDVYINKMMTRQLALVEPKFKGLESKFVGVHPTHDVRQLTDGQGIEMVKTGYPTGVQHHCSGNVTITYTPTVKPGK